MASRVGSLSFEGRQYWVISQPVPSPDAPLSEAEREVVSRYAEGHSLREVAQARGCSPRTIANQVQAAYRKLRVGSKSELVRALSERAQREG
jgi:DNA-binding CsgD family transcriptional regulator